jgi:hypothetical protein
MYHSQIMSEFNDWLSPAARGGGGVDNLSRTRQEKYAKNYDY